MSGTSRNDWVMQAKYCTDTPERVLVDESFESGVVVYEAKKGHQSLQAKDKRVMQLCDYMACHNGRI
jgi:hypothetical protein